MLGTSNAVGGTKLFAAIGVNYPAGSTVTCTNGTKTLTAKNTSGQWVFAIPKPKSLPETWIVTATDGTETASESVSITAEGQFASVELVYWDGTLYDAGNEYESITGGWSVAGSATKQGAYLDVYVPPRGARGSAYTNGAIDLTKWSKVNFNLTNVGESISLVVATTPPQSDWHEVPYEYTAAATETGNSGGTRSVDVSALKGSYYIYCGQFTTSSSFEYGADVTKVWLT